MALLDAYQEDFNIQATDLSQRPGQAPRQAPRFSLWGAIKTAPVSLGVGVIGENIASTADVLGAFGQVLATTEGSAGGMFSTQSDDERRQSQDATRKLLEQGPDYMSPAGRVVRDAGRSMLPDPLTTHAAEVAVSELFRVGGKAVGAMLVTGNPVAGAVISGAEEGFTQSDRLAMEGVDVGTRTAVGGVTAAVQAATFALPVAGKTVGQTVGLALGGGPVAYIGQQAAVREILQRADYSKLADQYDPFDPVGLTLSTLLPLGFGAMAMRSARVRGAAVAEAARAGEAPPSARTQVAEAVQGMGRVSDDVVDAARVLQIREAVDSWNLGRAGDIEAANAHLNAMARAADQLSLGARASVTDLLPVEVLRSTRVMDDMIARMESQRIELLADAAGRADPGAVREMRLELDSLRAQVPDTSLPAVNVLARDLQKAEGISFKKAKAQAQRQLNDLRDEYSARIARIEGALDQNAAAQQSFDALNVLDRQLNVIRADRASIDAPPTARNPIAEAAGMVAEQGGAGRAARAPEQAAAPAARAEAAPARAEPAEPGRQEPAAGGMQAENEVAGLEARAADIEALAPDMPIRLEGMDAPEPLSQLMARLRQEMADELQDVPLLQVAAECAIRTQ
ncbi:hypothetical protein [Comamonas sp. F1-6]|uniref:hypothetical protein n=1 Tax=Comamonas sp. F1-6 TaxID=673550 RepID=UPI0031D7B5D5